MQVKSYHCDALFMMVTLWNRNGSLLTYLEFFYANWVRLGLDTAGQDPCMIVFMQM